MCSACSTALACRRRVFTGLAVLALSAVASPAALAGGTNEGVSAQLTPPSRPDEFRVCADPNNLPFSNARGEGFENALATLFARELHRNLQYTFWPQRRGFIRHTLRAGLCDVLMGVPAGYEAVDTTPPYYRSAYVFVTRRGGPVIHSFDDPRLRSLAIGVHTIGDDYDNVPPAQVLASRGLVENVRGYSIYGAYSQADPPRALIDAVAKAEIDVAIAWGPLAGYFAKREPTPLQLSLPADRSQPLSFAIALGVRHGDDALRRGLERVLRQRSADIRRVLMRYGVPVLTGRDTERSGHAS